MWTSFLDGPKDIQKESEQPACTGLTQLVPVVHVCAFWISQMSVLLFLVKICPTWLSHDCTQPFQTCGGKFQTSEVEIHFISIFCHVDGHLKLNVTLNLQEGIQNHEFWLWDGSHSQWLSNQWLYSKKNIQWMWLNQLNLNMTSNQL